jgi:hypothetical protein
MEVSQIAPRPEAHRLSTLERIDYEDCFLAPVDPSEHTAEEWARAMIEGTSRAQRESLVRGWKMLGLKHGPADSPDHVLGWPIRRNEPDTLLLGADSRIGMPGELLFKREPDGLLFATFIGWHNPAARLIWAPVGAPHRRIVAELLTRATARLGAQRAAAPVAA